MYNYKLCALSIDLTDGGFILAFYTDLALFDLFLVV